MPARTRPTCDLTVFWRWLVPRYVAGDGGERVDLRGAHLGRPRSEAAVGREERGGDRRCRGPGTYEIMASVTTHSSTTELRRISRRAAAVAPSATLAVDAKAKALQAAGEHVIGFGAGEPDFPTPAHIVEAAVAACRDPANHHYTPTGGHPRAARGHRGQDRARLGLEVTASQVLVTNGGKQAVANAFAVLCDPGDEVLVLAPYWTTYPESIALAGGTPVVVPSDETTGFRSSVDDLERGVDARTPRRCSSCRRPTRPARSTPATRSRPSAAGRSRRASGS